MIFMRHQVSFSEKSRKQVNKLVDCSFQSYCHACLPWCLVLHNDYFTVSANGIWDATYLPWWLVEARVSHTSIHYSEPGCFPMPQMVVVRATTYISIILMMTGVIVERYPVWRIYKRKNTFLDYSPQYLLPIMKRNEGYGYPYSFWSLILPLAWCFRRRLSEVIARVLSIMCRMFRSAKWSLLWYRFAYTSFRIYNC